MSVHEHPGLMEITDEHGFEVWAKMETHFGSPEGPDTNCPSFPEFDPIQNPIELKLGSPSTAPPHPIDLTTSSDHHYVESFEQKTPLSHSEVPGYVLARLRDEEYPPPHPPPLMEKRTTSAAKVCLEKRFNTMAPEPVTLLDLQSAVINQFLSKLQESEKALEHVPHPKMQNTVTVDTDIVCEASNSCAEGAFNPFQCICGQAHTYMAVPNKHQHGSLNPNSLALNLYQEVPHPQIHNSSNTEGAYAVTTASIREDSSPTHLFKLTSSTKESKMSVVASQKEGNRKQPMSVAQRKARHNIMERERRRKIRQCHDQLNTLVPFCDADTDKVTTLQWTTAYLEYIKQIYGDVFKEEFTAFISKTRVYSAAMCPASKKPNKEEVSDKRRVEQ